MTGKRLGPAGTSGGHRIVVDPWIVGRLVHTVDPGFRAVAAPLPPGTTGVPPEVGAGSRPV